MRNKQLNMVLLCVCIALAIICCISAMKGRNEDPYFRVENTDLVYAEGMSDLVLLEGISAYDKEDGEISDKIVIRSKMKSAEAFTVVYVVKDSNNNMATYTRIYQLNSEKETNISVEDETSPAESEETESMTEESSQELEAESEIEASQEAEVSADIDPEAPVLVLNGNSAVISAGSNFNYWDYIASIGDNKDDTGYLSGQIVVSGYYDKNVPGTYELEFWLLDSDGNRCIPQKFQLTVQ